MSRYYCDNYIKLNSIVDTESILLSLVGNLSKLSLIPISLSSGSRNQTRDGSRDGKTSLLSSIDKGDLGELLLVPLGLSGGAGDEARGARHRETPLLYPVPLDLLVEVALQLEDVLVLLLQAEAGDGARHRELGHAHAGQDAQNNKYLHVGSV